jgi:hypothetical protein
MQAVFMEQRRAAARNLGVPPQVMRKIGTIPDSRH